MNTNLFIIVALFILLFIFLFLSSYFLLKEISANKVIIQNKLIEEKNNLFERSEARIKREKKLRLEDGDTHKHNFIYKTDLLLEQSNIKKYIPFFNSEIFIGSSVTIIILMYIISFNINKSYYISAIVSLTTIFLIYGALELLSDFNYKNTEKNILQFANLLQSYSMTSDDIITIFSQTYIYMREPLKSKLKECCEEAKLTGDVSLALNNFRLKIEHEKFKEIIKNIEICSRHESNYGVIVENIRLILKDYLRSKEEVKAMASNAKLQVVSLVTVGLISVKMTEGFLSNSAISTLQNSFLGKLLLTVGFLIIMICIYRFITINKKIN